MWPLRSTTHYGVVLHMRVPPQFPSCCLHCTPAGPKVRPQSTLSDRIIKAGEWRQAFHSACFCGAAWAQDSGHSAGPVGEPHPGQGIVGLSPWLAACCSGCIGLVCMPRPWTKVCLAGVLGQYWFWEHVKNVKMLSCIHFPQFCLFLQWKA